MNRVGTFPPHRPVRLLTLGPFQFVVLAAGLLLLLLLLIGFVSFLIYARQTPPAAPGLLRPDPVVTGPLKPPRWNC